MAPTPVRHPLRDDEAAARRRAIAAHPAGTARAIIRPARAGARPTLGRDGTVPSTTLPAPVVDHRAAVATGEDGSMTTEYGLIVVVGATACSLVIKWASGGAIFELLGGVLDAAKGLVGF